MAKIELRLAENAEGEFFVDSSCIDCGVCREVAPTLFERSDSAGASVVRRQPASEDELVRAGMGLIACPTSSIGTLHKIDLSIAQGRFPEPIDADVDDVAFCGWASKSS